MSSANLRIVDQTLVVGPFQCNCRLLACPRTGDAVLIDPGDEPARILEWVDRARTPDGRPVNVKALFHTHAHLDHVGATREVKEELTRRAGVTPPEIFLHQADEFIYQKLVFQGQLFGFTHYKEPLPVDRYFQDEEELRIGELRFSVIHSPGHSPGSVGLRLHEDAGLAAPETLFSGDTLFQGSVGRTDLWGGDQDLMFKNIRNRFFTLDDDTRVCPGHGPETKVGIEKRENPFFA